MFSIWAVVDVTFVKIHPHMHILSARLGLHEGAGFWVTHVDIRPTPVPFLKISTKTTTDVQDTVTLLRDRLYQRSLGLVVILSDLFHGFE